MVDLNGVVQLNCKLCLVTPRITGRDGGGVCVGDTGRVGLRLGSHRLMELFPAGV